MSTNTKIPKWIQKKPLVLIRSDEAFSESLDNSRQGFKYITIGYEILDRTYLREADLLGLIRSGYIKTHNTETEALATIIQEAARSKKAVMLARQKKIQESEQ